MLTVPSGAVTGVPGAAKSFSSLEGSTVADANALLDSASEPSRCSVMPTSASFDSVPPETVSRTIARTCPRMPTAVRSPCRGPATLVVSSYRVCSARSLFSEL